MSDDEQKVENFGIPMGTIKEATNQSVAELKEIKTYIVYLVIIMFVLVLGILLFTLRTHIKGIPVHIISSKIKIK